ncbi:hypothetical protein F5Y18DRAFT_433379 [Xylariaceae sp. FL1019]|nr:hypothetical protein F5Y18DRAFT_433379 [Xylariaceae sp. FL1019]
MSLNITSSAFLYCPPVTQTLFTTVYETVLVAACETGSWTATYTLTETCAGNPSDYVTPTIPPGFVVTTVSCSVCEEEEIEITCPGAQPTGMGMSTVEIQGNGVTATICATPPPAPAMGGSPAPAGPTATGESIPSTNESNPPANGSNPPTDESIPPSNESGMGGAGSNGIGGGASSNGVAPAGSNGTVISSNPTMPPTAGASSVKRSLFAAAGMAVLAVPLLL